MSLRGDLIFRVFLFACRFSLAHYILWLLSVVPFWSSPSWIGWWVKNLEKRNLCLLGGFYDSASSEFIKLDFLRQASIGHYSSTLHDIFPAPPNMASRANNSMRKHFLWYDSLNFALNPWNSCICPSCSMPLLKTPTTVAFSMLVSCVSRISKL